MVWGKIYRIIVSFFVLIIIAGSLYFFVDRSSLSMSTVFAFLIWLSFVGIFVFIGTAFSGNNTIFQPLSKVEIARGLITFLFSLVTVAIAATMVVFIIAKPDIEPDAFNSLKDILTIMIGILGTIVGFYFGLTPQTQAQLLLLAPVTITDEKPAANGKTTIITYVSGGKAPYTYSIKFDPGEIKEVSGISQDGSIKEDIMIPNTVHSNTKAIFQIVVEDSDGNSNTFQNMSMKFTVT